MFAEEIFESCAFKRDFSSPAFSTLLIMAERSFSFICAAAFFVNVTASTSSKSTPFDTAFTSFSIITKVLPLPAEAETIVLPRLSIAATCSSVRFISVPPYFSNERGNLRSAPSVPTAKPQLPPALQ